MTPRGVTFNPLPSMSFKKCNSLRFCTTQNLTLEYPILLERKAAEGKYNSDKLFISLALRKVDRGGDEDNRTVYVTELGMIAVNQTDRGMRTKEGDGEHFQ